MTRLRYKTFIDIARPAILLLLLFVQFCSDGDIADTLFERALEKSIKTSIYSYVDDGTFFHYNMSIDPSGTIFQIGEDAVNANEALLMDGFVTFDISTSLTSMGVTVERIIYATVSIYREGYNGDAAKLGSLHVDHCITSDPTTVTAADIFTFALPAESTWTAIPVTERLKADLKAARTYSSYRIYYNSPVVDSVYDLVKFHSEGNANPPHLDVWYL